MTENSTVSLDPETAKHIWQVLRMDAEDKVMLTDGNGNSAIGSIHTAERHKCNVSLDEVTFHPREAKLLHLCIGFTKNNSRNEWLLEKATELGVASIIPIQAIRTEKAHIRFDRWNKILQSAILQSQQYYLPRLPDIIPLHQAVELFNDVPQKLIAHCNTDKTRRPLSEMLKPGLDSVILIGPEGDFTVDEVNLCREHGFKAVSLGTQRLRTETAAITAAAFFNVIYDGQI